MPSLTCFNVRFTPNWLMIFLASLFIFLFVRLGFWQLQRADEKKQMLVAQQEQALQVPMEWQGQQGLPKQYQQIRLVGHYLPYTLFLDNQHYQHQFGYDVLTPAKIANGNIVIIDRGWVAGDMTRRALPQIDNPKGLVTIEGSVYFPSEQQWVLGPELEKKEKKIIILERMDTKLISQVLQKKVYPFIMRLNKNEAHGFQRDWKVVSMPPQRHLAYALQWFSMALVVFIIFVALNLKKKR